MNAGDARPARHKFPLNTGAVLGVFYDPVKRYILFFDESTAPGVELCDRFLGGFPIIEQEEMVFCISTWMCAGRARLDPHADSPVYTKGVSALPAWVGKTMAEFRVYYSEGGGAPTWAFDST